jgi:hypothetical protein
MKGASGRMWHLLNKCNNHHDHLNLVNSIPPKPIKLYQKLQPHYSLAHFPISKDRGNSLRSLVQTSMSQTTGGTVSLLSTSQDSRLKEDPKGYSI